MYLTLDLGTLLASGVLTCSADGDPPGADAEGHAMEITSAAVVADLVLHAPRTIP